MELIDKILKIAPNATVLDYGQRIVELAPKDFRAVAEALRSDKVAPMDYLRDIVGMDWGETLGALYYLESSKDYSQVTLKTATADRENPLLPTVCDLWKTAEIKEREVYDFYGIRFLNHPDMRRLFLREDWVGYPLRKDYDMNSNPLDLCTVITDTASSASSLITPFKRSGSSSINCCARDKNCPNVTGASCA